mmetsp:Transcript_86166/g.257170  ORF Transcript_86166/g.257170 Transcript_86166/m.257170 type:complete len:206 (+) Transcript_86166:431-1048(+)
MAPASAPLSAALASALLARSRSASVGSGLEGVMARIVWGNVPSSAALTSASMACWQACPGQCEPPLSSCCTSRITDWIMLSREPSPDALSKTCCVRAQRASACCLSTSFRADASLPLSLAWIKTFHVRPWMSSRLLPSGSPWACLCRMPRSADANAPLSLACRSVPWTCRRSSSDLPGSKPPSLAMTASSAFARVPSWLACTMVS